MNCLNKILILGVILLLSPFANAQIEVGEENNVGIRRSEQTNVTLSIENKKGENQANDVNVESKTIFKIPLLSSSKLYRNCNLEYLGNINITNGVSANGINLDLSLIDTLHGSTYFASNTRMGINNNLELDGYGEFGFFSFGDYYGIKNNLYYQNSPSNKLDGSAYTAYGIHSVLNLATGFADRYGIYNEVKHEFPGTPSSAAPFSFQYGMYNILHALGSIDTSSNAPIALYSEIDITTGEGGGRKYAGYFVGDVKIENTLFVDNIAIISDERLKESIVDIPNALNVVKELRPVSFHYKTSGINVNPLPTSLQYGLIAQEVEQVLPNLVKDAVFVNPLRDVEVKDNQGNVIGIKHERDRDQVYKSVNYVQLVPFLLKAIQEQQAQIDSLRADIEILKKK